MNINLSSYWKSSSKITTPSIKVDNSYIPLFSGSRENQQGNYFYGLDSNVTVDGSLHPVTYRNYRKTYTGTISCSISHNEKEAYTATRPATREESVSGSYGPYYASTNYFGYMLLSSVRINFNEGFNSTPSVSLTNSAYFIVSNVSASGCNLSVAPAWINWLAACIANSVEAGTAAIVLLAAQGTHVNASGSKTISYTESYTAYRDKTKYLENYAYGSFNFGVTYSGTPSVTANNGVEITGISSTGISFRKKLGGNASTGKTVNLTFNFSLSINGNA